MKIAILLDKHSYTLAELKDIVAQDTLNLCDKPDLKAWLTGQRMIKSCTVNQTIVKLVPEQRPIVYMKLDNFESTAKSLLNI